MLPVDGIPISKKQYKDPRLSQASKLVKDFVDCVRESEEEEGTSHYVLFEEFNRVMQKHIDTVMPYHEYWAESSYFSACFDYREIVPDSSGSLDSDLLVFSINQDLQFYVAWKLDHEPRLIRRRRGHSLLYHALGLRGYEGYPLALIHGRTVKMTQLLLERGASPCETFSSEDAIHASSLTVSDAFLRGLYNQKCSPAEAEYQIASELLKYSGEFIFASWYIALNLIHFHPQRSTILEIVRSVFQPDQASELESLIMKSLWRRIQRRWTESLWGGLTISLYFFIGDIIRLNVSFVPWLCTILYGLMFSAYRKLRSKSGLKEQRRQPGEAPPEEAWSYLLLVIFSFALFILFVVLYILFCLSILYMLLNRIQQVTSSLVSFPAEVS